MNALISTINYVIMIVVLLSAVACGPTSTGTHVQDLTTNKVQSLRRFTIDIPPGWSSNDKRVKLDNSGTFRELTMTSNVQVGSSPVLVDVISVPWDGHKRQDFAAMVALALMQRTNVIDMVTVIINGTFGTMIMYQDHADVGVVQLNVAGERRGFSVVCAGDANSAHELIGVCKSVISSFKLQ